jgi:4-hydroxy-3-methylbut-2-en-1-yl diphosphate reductase
VLITAGASAPESVVMETVDWLAKRYNAVVREQVIREEEVHFPLPKPLRMGTRSGSEDAADAASV